MLKTLARKEGGKRVIVIGLSEINIARLLNGEPIHADLEDIHAEGFEIMIFAGKTEAQMAKDLVDGFKAGGASVHYGDPAPDWVKGN